MSRTAEGRAAVITCYVVVPYDPDDRGNLGVIEPVEAPNGDIAKRRAAALVPKHARDVALSRTGDPGSGEFGEEQVIAAQ